MAEERLAIWRERGGVRDRGCGGDNVAISGVGEGAAEAEYGFIALLVGRDGGFHGREEENREDAQQLHRSR